MRRKQGRFFLGAALAVFAASVWMLSAAPVAASPAQSNASSLTTGSVLDGVFTSDQVARGQDMFQKICSACHTIAEHSGRKFEDRWGGMTLGDFFDVISNTMPDGNPGSLKPEEYASIIAFLLKETGYPEGKQELPADSAVLMKVRVEPLPR